MLIQRESEKIYLKKFFFYHKKAKNNENYDSKASQIIGGIISFFFPDVCLSLFLMVRPLLLYFAFKILMALAQKC
jgi:hypothetical protein